MRRSGFALSDGVEGKIELAICLWLAALVVVFVGVSLHWPMVGDVTFMHYVIFLMKHGMVPYRDIVDMNLPGSYLLEAMAMRLPFSDAVSWRVYDFGLLLVAGGSLVTILRRQGWLSGILAAALFALIHGQDGTVMAGERDFAGAVFLLAGVAFLFAASRGLSKETASLRRSILICCSGFSLSCGGCVKPTLFPVILCALAWVIWQPRQKQGDALATAGLMLAAAALPIAATFGFLVREDTLADFVHELRSLLPYHATIDERPFAYLFLHSFAPLLAMLALWAIAVWLVRGAAGDTERWALVMYTLCGLFSYVVQRKGFSYQRYPMLAFLLPLMIGDFARLLKSGSFKRVFGVVGIAAGVLIASQSAIRLTRFQRTPPAQPLLKDLATFGTPAELSGHIQCMDTIGSCIDNLYAARIVQSTGFLYDCYLLGGQGASDDAWVTEELRRKFWRQMERNVPQLIVVTDSLCYQPAASFDKYGHWPEFQSYLANNYVLVKQSGPQAAVHYWSRSLVPPGYRIYERREDIHSAGNEWAR